MVPLPFSTGGPAHASHSPRVRTAIGMASRSRFFIVEFRQDRMHRGWFIPYRSKLSPPPIRRSRWSGWVTTVEHKLELTPFYMAVQHAHIATLWNWRVKVT